MKRSTLDCKATQQDIDALNRSVIFVGAAVLVLPMVMVLIGSVIENNQTVEARETLQERFRNNDTQVSEVFASVAQCISKGYNLKKCRSSEKSAKEIADNYQTTFTYASLTQCAKKHRQCIQRPMHIKHQRGYSPVVVAWQASQVDIEQSVPLYGASETEYGVRLDGKKLPLMTSRNMR